MLRLKQQQGSQKRDIEDWGSVRKCSPATQGALSSIPSTKEPGLVVQPVMVILNLGRWTQKDPEFKVILCYIEGQPGLHKTLTF